MRSERKALRRSDITERIDDSERSMSEAEDSVEETVDDGEIVERTEDAVDISTTEDGGQDVRRHLEDAGDAVNEAYDERDGRLEELQNESAEFKEDIGERAEAAETNERTVAESQKLMRVREAVEQIDRSLDVIREETSFLTENREAIDRLKEASVNRRKALQARHGRT